MNDAAFWAKVDAARQRDIQAVKPMCSNCYLYPQRRKQRCEACYSYLRRTGEDRPQALAIKHMREKIYAGRESHGTNRR